MTFQYSSPKGSKDSVMVLLLKIYCTNLSEDYKHQQSQEYIIQCTSTYIYDQELVFTDTIKYTKF